MSLQGTYQIDSAHSSIVSFPVRLDETCVLMKEIEGFRIMSVAVCVMMNRELISRITSRPLAKGAPSRDLKLERTLDHHVVNTSILSQ